MSAATLTAPPAPAVYTVPDAAYERAFAAIAARAGEPAALRQLRRSAFAQLQQRGFPTSKHEEYRQTNLAAVLQRSAFALPERPGAAELREAERAAQPGAAFGGPQLTFVDGHFTPELSRLKSLPAGVRAGALLAAGGAGDDRLARLGELADIGGENTMVAFNTAFFGDGAWIEIAPGAQVDAQIEIVHLATGGAGVATMAHPRHLILAGRGSRAKVVETYLSLNGAAHLTNAVTEIFVAANAELEHARLQQENTAAYHISAVHSRQAADSRLRLHALTFGGAMTRNDVVTVLHGPGAEALLNGLYVAEGRQHVDNHTVLDHAEPRGASREYYRGILDGQATTAFRGRILVRPDAQHTDAVQSDKNLLLSSDCTANADPQLEIRADDVRCTHGATFGQIDEEALFYLRSRGVGAEMARHLLIFAFAAEALGRLNPSPLRTRLETELFSRWTGLTPPEGAEASGG
jgi:Fe-S cluster assembly protein SufD